MDYLTSGETSPEPSLAVRYATLTEHFDAMLAHYGEYAGLRIARKHIGWYSKGIASAAEFRAAVNNCGDAGKVRGMIDVFFKAHGA
jgi:tRNA-dihydrouridine synthase B